MPKDLSAGAAPCPGAALIPFGFTQPEVGGRAVGRAQGGTEDMDRKHSAVPWGSKCPPHTGHTAPGPIPGHWGTSRHVLQGAFLTLAQQIPAWSCQQCSYSLGREEKHQHLLPQLSQLGKTSKPQTSASHTHKSTFALCKCF